ncbi:peptide methionine sulfoxide reductase MsrA [Dichotomocladium elegans]|nr:peptide methionine sulfoxide reductase MsrA [Dichotomocladium elegans]
MLFRTFRLASNLSSFQPTEFTMTETATFAAGCFWGVEHLYKKHFGKDGVTTKVGYTGGNTDNPNYCQVCSGQTEHAEAVELTFDPECVSYATLVEFFYKMHDPTTANRQGPDVGSQYRSAIFYHSQQQKETAEKVTEQVQAEHYPNKPIVTEIIPASIFYDAEAYHQLYLEKNPGGYECPTHFLRW